ncbi:MAG TPA: hypothetical protein VM307_14270 [Egibacteraceae bacterium]|nr:hypothetical protein [Egibacteraceae bacterium]
MEQERRRRIDRVTAEDYLAGLDAVDVPQLRTMRDDCREEEARLSYARRVLHGQLDIVRAEQRRRTGDDDQGLVGTLTEILSDDPAPRSREARTAPLYAPDDDRYGHRAHDTLVDDAQVSRVPDLDDGELAGLLQRLQDKEEHISSLRRTVLTHLDALQDELISRYRDGSVDVDEVVASAVSARPDDTA